LQVLRWIDPTGTVFTKVIDSWVSFKTADNKPSVAVITLSDIVEATHMQVVVEDLLVRGLSARGPVHVPD
jgi:hypothetical protein